MSTPRMKTMIIVYNRGGEPLALQVLLESISHQPIQWSGIIGIVVEEHLWEPQVPHLWIKALTWLCYPWGAAGSKIISRTDLNTNLKSFSIHNMTWKQTHLSHCYQATLGTFRRHWLLGSISTWHTSVPEIVLAILMEDDPYYTIQMVLLQCRAQVVCFWTQFKVLFFILKA